MGSELIGVDEAYSGVHRKNRRTPGIAGGLVRAGELCLQSLLRVLGPLCRQGPSSFQQPRHPVAHHPQQALHLAYNPPMREHPPLRPPFANDYSMAS